MSATPSPWPRQRGFSPLYPSYRSAFADLLGVRFIATGVPVEQIDSSLKPGDLELIARTKDAYVYENPRALPRVMLLTDWRLADFDELMRSGWPARRSAPDRAPEEAADRVLPQRGGRHAAAARASCAMPIPRWWSRSTRRGGGILLLNDVWHPWWRATVDGADAEILKANVIFRAVVVPRGRHVVRFSFHPFAGAFGELVGKVRRAH